MPQSDRHGRQHWLQQLAFFSIRWELELVLQKEHLESFWPYYLQSLDAIDGKQARRTGTSSPLGELFDHGCDSLSTGSLDKISFCSSITFSLFCSFCLPCKLLRVENGRISSVVSLSMPDRIQVLSTRMMSFPCKQFFRVPSPACFTVLTGKPMCLAHSSLATLTSLRASLLSWGSCWFHLWKISWTSTSGWVA